MAQRVWSEAGLFRNSRSYYRLHTEIDVLRGAGHKEELEIVLEKEMDEADFSALIYDEPSDTFKLHSSVYLEEDNAPWLIDLFQASVALQAAEAEEISQRVGAKLHAARALSEHPDLGPRVEPHMLIESTADYFNLESAKPSHWEGNEEWNEVNWIMERQAQEWQKSDGNSIGAEFYWAPDQDQSIKLNITSQEPHKELGNGLHFTLTIPLNMNTRHIAYMALELNEHERSNWLKTHMIGSWCNHDQMLAFRLFIPNKLYQERVLHELAVTMAARAIWANEFFFVKKAQAEANRKASLH